MPRKRQIDPDIWTSEQFTLLSLPARLLFIGMFSVADDEGRLKGSPAALKARIFPIDTVELEPVRVWRDEILNARKNDKDTPLALLYEHRGNEYLSVTGFKKHQHINRKYPSKLPAPPELMTNSLPTHCVLTEPSLPPHGTRIGIGIGIGVGVEKERESLGKIDTGDMPADDTLSLSDTADTLRLPFEPPSVPPPPPDDKLTPEQQAELVNLAMELGGEPAHAIRLITEGGWPVDWTMQALRRTRDKGIRGGPAIQYARGTLRNWRTSGGPERDGHGAGTDTDQQGRTLHQQVEAVFAKRRKEEPDAHNGG